MCRPQGFQMPLYGYRLRVLDTHDRCGLDEIKPDPLRVHAGSNGHHRDRKEREMVAISCCMTVPSVFEECPGARLQEEKYSASAGESATDSGIRLTGGTEVTGTTQDTSVILGREDLGAKNENLPAFF